MLGHHTFSSEVQVLQIAMKECPQGHAFALFVDPVSIYCHDSMYAPVVGWYDIDVGCSLKGSTASTIAKWGSFHIYII